MYPLARYVGLAGSQRVCPYEVFFILTMIFKIQITMYFKYKYKIHCSDYKTQSTP